MKKHFIIFTVGMLIIPATKIQAQETMAGDTASWAAFFREAGVEGTFVLLDAETGKRAVFNGGRAHQRYLPASTFKIMNTLIALQNKTVSGIDDLFRWDGIHRSYESWNRDLSLREAFRISAVWVYQELAVRSGRQVIEKWMRECNYGNCLTGPEINSFWLDGDLAISAIEQTEFIRALCCEKLPFDKSVQQQVKEIMMADSSGGKELHAKTGWAARVENQTGWYVGYVQQANHYTVFALNIDINGESDLVQRIDISRRILDHEGLFPLKAE